MASTAYSTEDLVAGQIRSAYKTAAAATYHRGQVLGRTDTTSVYANYNGAGSGGLENIRAICIEDKLLGAEGELAVYITGSEVLGSGLKDGNGDSLTVNSTIIESAQDSGIIVK